MSRISDIAGEIASALHEEYGAEVTYSPVFELRRLSRDMCVVVPAGETLETASRSAVKRTYEIQVGLVRKSVSDEVSDAFVTTVEALGLRLRGLSPSGTTCTSITFDPLYSVDEIRRSNVLVSVVIAKYVEFCVP